MSKESKKLVALLEKAEVEKALKHAAKMRSKKQASQILSDFAVSLIRKFYEFEIAERLLKQAISLNPKHAEAFFNLGVLYTEPGFFLRNESKFAEAEKYYLKAVKIKPDYMEAHHNLALFYNFLGRKEEAELEYSVFKELCKDKEIVNALKRVLGSKIRK